MKVLQELGDHPDEAAFGEEDGVAEAEEEAGAMTLSTRRRHIQASPLLPDQHQDSGSEVGDLVSGQAQQVAQPQVIWLASVPGDDKTSHHEGAALGLAGATMIHGVVVRVRGAAVLMYDQTRDQILALLRGTKVLALGRHLADRHQILKIYRWSSRFKLY